MKPTRDEAKRMADEVLEILRTGAYVSPGGRRVAVGDLLADAQAATRSYPAERHCPLPRPRERATHVTVENTTTLAAARDLWEQGNRPAALNFANAQTPGGGFVIGARAQEESLCWASGLYACLLDRGMYPFHRERADALYTDTVIHSPEVPVFRGEDGRLLEEPWPLAFLTSPAPFATLHLLDKPDGAGDLEPVFESRIRKVLAVAATHGHEALVLGAWGCGAFGNDPEMVAHVFREALEGPFRGVFTDVVFAITDSTETHETLGPFETTFAV